MTKTLTLEVEEDVLARAEAAARRSGSDVRAELVSRLEEIGGRRMNRANEAMLRFVARARKNPVTYANPLPDREERNAR